LFKIEQTSIGRLQTFSQEICFQIDEHRERLKQKIGDIVLGLINETRKYESMYLNNFQRETHEIEETHPSTRLQEIDCNTLKLFFSKNKTCIYSSREKRERENYLNFIVKSNLESYSKHQKP
jgi:hypothetical protein